MRKKIICYLFVIYLIGQHAWSSVLEPSEIEALRDEFESLNSYKTETTYKLPQKEEPKLLNFPAQKAQFVDLDQIFNDNSSNSNQKIKRKRQ